MKKTQASHEKLKDEVDYDKDLLLSVQQQMETCNKKYMNDRLKSVSQVEMESSLKDTENHFNEKIMLVVQEAVD